MIIEESVLRKVLRRIIIESYVDAGADGFVVGLKYGKTSAGESLESTSFSDEDVDVADFKSNSSFSGRSSGIDINKVFQMSRETGMKPSAVFGIMTVESGGEPKSLATNPHKISGEPSLYSTPFGIQSAKVTAQWKSAGIPMKSLYNVHVEGNRSRDLFLKMMEVNKLATVSVTAFGSMQVMGAYILPLYSNNADTLLDAFKANPADFSLKALKAWIKHPTKSKFIEYVNNDNWEAAIKLYYGNANADYVAKASNAAKEFRKKINDYNKKANKTNAISENAKDSWKDRLGTETARGINFHKLKDNKNNYRAGIKGIHTNPTVDFFKELKSEYGITNVITLNGDTVGKLASENAKKAGLNIMYAPSNDDNKTLRIGGGYNFNDIKKQFGKGNTLIHCTHGADRTGGTIGRYYVDSELMSVEDALKDAYTYKSGGKSGFMAPMKRFIEIGPET